MDKKLLENTRTDLNDEEIINKFYPNHKILNIIEPGNSFGEIALKTEGIRFSNSNLLYYYLIDK